MTYSIQDVLKHGTAYRFAIDITHDPYYGEIIDENEGYVIHSQLKKSTTDFYSYVTVYAINKGRLPEYTFTRARYFSWLSLKEATTAAR